MHTSCSRNREGERERHFVCDVDFIDSCWFPTLTYGLRYRASLLEQYNGIIVSLLCCCSLSCLTWPISIPCEGGVHPSSSSMVIVTSSTSNLEDKVARSVLELHDTGQSVGTCPDSI